MNDSQDVIAWSWFQGLWPVTEENENMIQMYSICGFYYIQIASENICPHWKNPDHMWNSMLLLIQFKDIGQNS